MDRFREMQVFDAVAQAGSLAGGARALGLSQATVTRSLAALETRLQTPLLVRGPRGTRLNAAGEGFAASCRQILQEVADAERSATGLHAHPSGQLRVSVPRLMARQVLTPIVLDYLAQFPEVQLSVQLRDDTPRLLDEGIDVALVTGQIPDSSAFALPVGIVRPILCAAPRYLDLRGRPQTPEALRDHSIIESNAHLARTEWRFLCDGAARTIRLAPRLTCSTRSAALRAALLGLGLTRCMSHEVHAELQDGRLETVLEHCAAPGLAVQLHYREGQRAAARVRTFLDFALPRLRAHPALRG